MKKTLRIIAVALLMGVGAAPSALALEEHHRIVMPDAVEWTAGPPSIPEGSEAAVLYGNPAEEGVFALRLKLPADYHIPPHTHAMPEIVTVISGTFKVGMGENANEDEVESLDAGGFFAFEPGFAHYAYTDEETVIQLNSTGPWTLTYVNPEDDPREASE
jgi:quercetin dioxygenase-like cupin family protein